MYNLYYQLPIPVVNLIIGLGTGKKLDCPQCIWRCRISGKIIMKKGAATQWYTSIGIPLIPLFDIHLSYRSITSKNRIHFWSDKGKKDDY